jgi:hypothetical protein
MQKKRQRQIQDHHDNIEIETKNKNKKQKKTTEIKTKITTTKNKTKINIDINLSLSQGLKNYQLDLSKKSDEAKNQEWKRLTLEKIQFDNLNIIQRRKQKYNTDNTNIAFKYLPQTSQDLNFHSNETCRKIEDWIDSRYLDKYCTDKKADNRQILCIKGPPGSGKSTLARILLEKHGYDVTVFEDVNDNMATRNVIKEIASSVCSIHGKRKPAILMKNIENWKKFSWTEFGKCINLHDPDVRALNQQKEKYDKLKFKEKEHEINSQNAQKKKYYKKKHIQSLQTRIDLKYNNDSDNDGNDSENENYQIENEENEKENEEEKEKQEKKQNKNIIIDNDNIDKNGKISKKKKKNIIFPLLNPIICTYTPPYFISNSNNSNNNIGDGDDNNDENGNKYKNNQKLKDFLTKCKSISIKSISTFKVQEYIENIIFNENLTDLIDPEIFNQIKINAVNINNLLYTLQRFVKKSNYSINSNNNNNNNGHDNDNADVDVNKKMLEFDFIKYNQSYSNFNIFNFVIPHIEQIRNQASPLSLQTMFDVAMNYPNLKKFIHANYLQGYQNCLSFNAISEFADSISECDHKWKRTPYSTKIGIAHIANQKNTTKWDIKKFFNKQQKQKESKESKEKSKESKNLKNEENKEQEEKQKNTLVTMPVKLLHQDKKMSIQIYNSDLISNLPSSWLFGHSKQKQKQTIETLALHLKNKEEESMITIYYRLKPSIVNIITKC